MKEVQRQGLGKRTKDFALRIIRLYTAVPKTTEAQVVGKQLLPSGTSFVTMVKNVKNRK
jgi:hypothetical protein